MATLRTSEGRITGVNGNMVTVEFSGRVRQNEVAHVVLNDVKLMGEVIRIRGGHADLQIFEETHDLRIGGKVEFTGEMLSVELGPGILGQIYDGLQNPLPELAETCGFFLRRGVRAPSLPRDKTWDFTPLAREGARVRAGDALGWVPESIFEHRIMVPFDLRGTARVARIAPPGAYRVEDEIAVLETPGGPRPLTMIRRWPSKTPVTAYAERLRPTKQLETRQRILDTMFPIAKGGTYCIPGPFGSGKTVLQQLISRHALIDIVIVAACGERAGEVVETLREFPELLDPRTGRPLMERTIIICNTSSMPVAAREASVYTAVALGEYYRQMGLDVLVLADSTSRWAQAIREMSGRLEEIPGEEAFPAYLESVIASFYERAGAVRLHDGSTGSVTIGGAVSPAGGDFEEPVTQATLKVVGAFHGLSRERSDARRYPAIHPLESWSKYRGPLPDDQIELARDILRKGQEVREMMKVVEEEGTAMSDFVAHLKSEYLDAVYLQQDAYDEIDHATSIDRQKRVFHFIARALAREMNFADKTEARGFFHTLTQATIDWNHIAMESGEFAETETRLNDILAKAANHA